MRIKNSRIRSCAILQRFRCVFVYFFSCQLFFGYLLKKGTFCPFFLQKITKKLVSKKLKSPSKFLDKAASCHASVFKLRKVSLYFN